MDVHFDGFSGTAEAPSNFISLMGCSFSQVNQTLYAMDMIPYGVVYFTEAESTLLMNDPSKRKME
jgi:hypothetical protein